MRPPAPACVPGGVLTDLGEHLVPQGHEVELVRHDHRTRQGISYGFGVGGGQVNGHVRDLLLPRIRLSLQPFGHRAGRPSVDVYKEPGGAGRVHDPGVPPVVLDPPPAGD